MLTRYIALLFAAILHHDVTPNSFCISTLITIHKRLNSKSEMKSYNNKGLKQVAILSPLLIFTNIDDCLKS